MIGDSSPDFEGFHLFTISPFSSVLMCNPMLQRVLSKCNVFTKYSPNEDFETCSKTAIAGGFMFFRNTNSPPAQRDDEDEINCVFVIAIIKNPLIRRFC